MHSLDHAYILCIARIPSIECLFCCFLLSVDRDPEVDPAFYDSLSSILDEQGKHNLKPAPMFPNVLCSFASHSVQLSFGSLSRVTYLLHAPVFVAYTPDPQYLAKP